MIPKLGERESQREREKERDTAEHQELCRMAAVYSSPVRLSLPNTAQQVLYCCRCLFPGGLTRATASPALFSPNGAQHDELQST